MDFVPQSWHTENQNQYFKDKAMRILLTTQYLRRGKRLLIIVGNK